MTVSYHGFPLEPDITVSVQDGPFILVSPDSTESGLVLMTWDDRDGDGQWVLSVAEAHQLAVALYTVAAMVVR